MHQHKVCRVYTSTCIDAKVLEQLAALPWPCMGSTAALLGRGRGEEQGRVGQPWRQAGPRRGWSLDAAIMDVAASKPPSLG